MIQDVRSDFAFKMKEIRSLDMTQDVGRDGSHSALVIGSSESMSPFGSSINTS